MVLGKGRFLSCSNDFRVNVKTFGVVTRFEDITRNGTEVNRERTARVVQLG
jgi:hypothetical protein